MEDFRGFEAFEGSIRQFRASKDIAPRAGFAGFGWFEAFEGSMQQFRASTKEKTWPATAQQLQEPVWQVSEGLDGFEGSKISK